jgi:6-phosphogluconolactonase
MKADIRVFKDRQTLSIAAAEIFIEAAAQAVQARGRFLVALSGGGTPVGLYRLLTEELYRQQVDWTQTFVFWGDERCVPPDDPGSNYHQATQILLNQVPIPDENILRVKGELEPPEASEEYAQTLKRLAPPGQDWPRFDLVLLGMGSDGHTASLFPGSQVKASSPTRAVTANYEDRPAQRVTLTPVVFNSARNILFLVTGESKASTLKEVLRGVYQPELLPAQRIRPTDGKVIWLVDEAAASALPYSET